METDNTEISQELRDKTDQSLEEEREKTDEHLEQQTREIEERSGKEVRSIQRADVDHEGSAASPHENGRLR